MRVRAIAPALLAATVMAAPALAGSSGSRTTVEAINRSAGAIVFVDADHSGKPSTGDYEIGKTVLVDPASGKMIGRDTVVCTQLDASGLRYLCQGLVQLPRGELFKAGYFSVTSKSFRLAITGGTGDYAGVTGWQTGTWLDAKLTRARSTYTFGS